MLSSTIGLKLLILDRTKPCQEISCFLAEIILCTFTPVTYAASLYRMSPGSSLAVNRGSAFVTLVSGSVLGLLLGFFVGIGFRQFFFHRPQLLRQFGIVFKRLRKFVLIDFVTVGFVEILLCRLRLGQVAQEPHPFGRFRQLPLPLVPLALPPQLLLGHFSGRLAFNIVFCLSPC